MTDCATFELSIVAKTAKGMEIVESTKSTGLNNAKRILDLKKVKEEKNVVNVCLDFVNLNRVISAHSVS
jgi:hypothetical protein